MPQVDFLPFAYSAGANLVGLAEWEASDVRLLGFARGRASSAQANRIWKQTSLMVTALAQFIATSLNADVRDNVDVTELMRQIQNAVRVGAGGIAAPGTAQQGYFFIGGGLSIQLRPRIPGTGTTGPGHVMWNAYLDQFGDFRYLADGPALDLVFDPNQQIAAFRYGQPGNVNTTIPWTREVTFEPGLIGINSAKEGDNTGHFMVNAEWDRMNSRWIYTATGVPAFDLVFDADSRIAAFRYAPPGSVNTPAAFTRVATFEPGIIGMNTAMEGAVSGHLIVNAEWDRINNRWIYTNSGVPAFDLVFNGENGITALRQAPAGNVNAPVTAWSRTITMQPGVIGVNTSLEGANVGHFMVNAEWDPTGNRHIYTASGRSAFDLVFNTDSNEIAIRYSPPGTVNTPTAFTRHLTLDRPMANNETNFQLLCTQSGSTTLQTVMVGPPGSGPGGTGRALYVP